MLNEDLGVQSAALCIISLISIIDGASDYRFIQKMNNIPTSKVRSAAIGLVELYGRAKCKRPVFSPISKTKCVFWQITAESQNPLTRKWSHIHCCHSTSDFFLEDETGKMLVKLTNFRTLSEKRYLEKHIDAIPIDAKIEVPINHKYEGYLSEKGFLGLQQKKLDENVMRFIAERPSFAEWVKSIRFKIRISESYIRENDSIYILGTVAAKEEVGKSVPHDNLMITRGRDSTFHINYQSEKEIVNQVRKSMMIKIAIGIILGCIGIFIFLLNLQFK